MGMTLLYAGKLSKYWDNIDFIPLSHKLLENYLFVVSQVGLVENLFK